MHYLIDGHNLIAQLPDISLSDPDDEVKLILKLRQWTAARKKRKVTVYFDGGIPGGKKVELSNAQVKVYFASTGKTADSLLIRRIGMVRNPAEYILVSSDQQIIAAAKNRKMKYWRSQKFAMRMESQMAERQQPKVIDPQTDPHINDAEIAEWLELFGPVDEEAVRQQADAARRRRQKPPQEVEQESQPESQPPPANTDRENPELSDQELAEWLALFGGDSPKDDNRAKPKDKSSRPKPRRRPTPQKDNPYNLKRSDLDAWEAFANQDD